MKKLTNHPEKKKKCYSFRSIYFRIPIKRYRVRNKLIAKYEHKLTWIPNCEFLLDQILLKTAILKLEIVLSYFFIFTFYSFIAATSVHEQPLTQALCLFVGDPMVFGWKYLKSISVMAQ